MSTWLHAGIPAGCACRFFPHKHLRLPRPRYGFAAGYTNIGTRWHANMCVRPDAVLEQKKDSAGGRAHCSISQQVAAGEASAGVTKRIYNGNHSA